MRKRVYGLQPGEYERKWEAQGRVCMICKQESQVKNRAGETKLLAQDHDHKTGENRDLLCDQCNRGLGNFRESPELLKAAAQYLERWAKPPDASSPTRRPFCNTWPFSSSDEDLVLPEDNDKVHKARGCCDGWL